VTVSSARRSEIGALAHLWYDGWQDAHAAILPKVLARARTCESFVAQLEAALGHVRVIGPSGAPLGLCMVITNLSGTMPIDPSAASV
jgi:hypothetical protein